MYFTDTEVYYKKQLFESPPQKPKLSPIDVSLCVRQFCQLDQGQLRRQDAPSVTDLAAFTAQRDLGVLGGPQAAGQSLTG